MNIQRTPASSGNPFLDADLVEHLRVDDPVQMAEALRHARAAAAELEHYAQIALLLQTVRVELTSWPDRNPWPLPVQPFLPGDMHTLTFTVDGEELEPHIDVGMQPGLRAQLWLHAEPRPGAVVIEYQAGFGDTASLIPPDLRHAIMDQAAAFMDLRGASDGKVQALSPHAARLAARYRRVGI